MGNQNSGNRNAKAPPERHWKPGHSGNPSGRPKVWREFQELCRSRAPEAFDVLMSSVVAGEPWATTLLLAYAWGNPSQKVHAEINVTYDPQAMTDADLAAIASSGSPRTITQALPPPEPDGVVH